MTDSISLSLADVMYMYMFMQAVEMFTDLCQFERAKEFASSSRKHDVKNLITKQADWAKDTNDPRAAW